MDGDLYLIKLIKNRPILWRSGYTKKNIKEGRESAWTEVAAKIGTDIDWIKSRWYRLQEKYFNALKSEDTKMQKKFKYFQQMTFLALPTTRGSSKKLQDDDEPEFFITLKDIQSEDDGRVNLFELIVTGKGVQEHKSKEAVQPEVHSAIAEVFDYEESESQQRDIENIHDETVEEHSPKQDNNEIEIESVEEQLEGAQDESVEVSVIENDDEPMLEPDDVLKPITKEANNSTLNEVNAEDDSGNERQRSTKIVQEIVASQPKSTEVPIPDKADRCEDTIFGELVSAMLKGMPETKKKQVKKEIMYILLS